MRKLLIGLSAAALALALMGAGPGGQRIYAQFEGVPGDVSAKEHEGWIELSAVSFGSENSQSISSVRGGSGAGKATFKELTIRKLADRASPELFQRATTNKLIPRVRIDFVRSDSQVVRELALERVIVRKFERSRNPNPGDPAEIETFCLEAETMTESSRTLQVSAPLNRPQPHVFAPGQ